MDLSRLTFDPVQRKLAFRGTCLSVLSLCQAMCCRLWDITLSPSEHASGLYGADRVCVLTRKGCEEEAQTCINRRYRLKRREDGACIYLDHTNQCSIYEHRPQVCKDFVCEGGWRLTSVYPTDKEGKGADPAVEKQQFLERLSDDLVFVLHPLLKTHAVFYLKGKGQIVFVKEMVGQCGAFRVKDDWHNPKLDNDSWRELIDLFGRKDTLGSIRRRFCRPLAADLEKDEFYEIVWLLNKHNIIADSRHFAGSVRKLGIPRLYD